MNENLNLAEILKDCPKGTKLYSTIFGDVYLNEVNRAKKYPIIVASVGSTDKHSFTSGGKLIYNYNGECTLFPSKDQRDWSKFRPKKPKFDPNTLQPFDKLVVKYDKFWVCGFFSHRRSDECECPYFMTDLSSAKFCIPYNEETKNLIGTNEEAPEYYRYWED